MSNTFFISWQLWEQMTFVLAAAIVLVFCLGWMKLWWTSRKNRRRVVMDEENRAKIEDLRSSGNIIKLDQEKDDIPFGVRALQSGIEIDGIWVSASSTPISESLKQFRDSDRSSSSSFGSINDERPLSQGELTPPRMSFSGQLQTAVRPGRLPTEPPKGIDPCRTPNARVLLRDVASAYKPRRSSHLRFSSSGENKLSQDTASQLENIALALPQKTHHDRRSYIDAIIVDSSSESAADNEHSSGSDSDSTLTGQFVVSKIKQIVEVPCSKNISSKSNKRKDRSDRNSEDSNKNLGLSSRGDYSSVPQECPERKVHVCASPDTLASPRPMTIGADTRLPQKNLKGIGETRWPLLSNNTTEVQTEPIFTPGTLHVNRTARKINPGFELLPAGTFSPINVSAKNPEDENQACAGVVAVHEKRLSKKLQKRARDSDSTRRSSTGFKMG